MKIYSRIETLKMELENNPEDRSLWIEYAEFLITEDNIEEAITAYYKAQALEPDRDLTLQIGWCYVVQGNWERGIFLINEVIKKNPTDYAYCMLAHAYLKNGKYSDAENASRKAIQINPEYDEAYFLIGESVRHNSKEKALGYYRKAVDLNPRYAYAWYMIGRLSKIVNRSNINESINALYKTIELDNNIALARVTLANALWIANRYEEAEEQYKIAIQNYPNNSQMHDLYGDFLFAQERTEEAKREKEIAADLGIHDG